MKTISIKQPWAHLICAEIKDIENRTWPTKFRGRVLVHASACKKTDHQVSGELFDWCRKNYQTWAFGCQDSPKSAIIGSVEIVDCVQNHESIWAEHKAFKKVVKYGIESIIEVPVHNLVLANPVLFAKPITNVKGKLSFWEYDLNVCHICGQPTEFICQDCDEPFCDNHSAVYDQFNQIDFDCCSECAEKRKWRE